MIKTRPSTATLATTPVTARGHVSSIYIASAVIVARGGGLLGQLRGVTYERVDEDPEGARQPDGGGRCTDRFVNRQSGLAVPRDNCPYAGW